MFTCPIWNPPLNSCVHRPPCLVPLCLLPRLCSQHPVCALPRSPCLPPLCPHHPGEAAELGRVLKVMAAARRRPGSCYYYWELLLSRERSHMSGIRRGCLQFLLPDLNKFHIYFPHRSPHPTPSARSKAGGTLKAVLEHAVTSRQGVRGGSHTLNVDKRRGLPPPPPPPPAPQEMSTLSVLC